MRPDLEIVSVNIGAAEVLAYGERRHTSGICKHPVEGAVTVCEAGLRDDVIVDSKHHGGPDQAVYVYSLEDYLWWSETTGRNYQPGLFGENLTIRGLPTDLPIGDRLLIGDVVLEATAPRIPCGTLAARMQDHTFGHAFRRASRPGFYCRVLNPGTIQAGDPVELVECGVRDVTVLDLFEFAYARRHDATRLEAYLEAPIAERFRRRVEAALSEPA